MARAATRSRSPAAPGDTVLDLGSGGGLDVLLPLVGWAPQRPRVRHRREPADHPDPAAPRRRAGRTTSSSAPGYLEDRPAARRRGRTPLDLQLLVDPVHRQAPRPGRGRPGAAPGRTGSGSTDVLAEPGLAPRAAAPPACSVARPGRPRRSAPAHRTGSTVTSRARRPAPAPPRSPGPTPSPRACPPRSAGHHPADESALRGWPAGSVQPRMSLVMPCATPARARRAARRRNAGPRRWTVGRRLGGRTGPHSRGGARAGPGRSAPARRAGFRLPGIALRARPGRGEAAHGMFATPRLGVRPLGARGVCPGARITETKEFR